jgi:Fe-S-cluster containining protein
MTSREEIAADLERELLAARNISVEDIASRIEMIGFQCLRCGECCTGDYNSVTVFPFEVRRILKSCGEEWLEAVEPPEVGEWDRQGRFHTLEWRLKKETGRCRYYSEGGCSIYQVRPFICRTYPFYLVKGVLRLSECRGLGKAISRQEAASLAALLKDRYITELEEALALLQNFCDFERGTPIEKGDCIVHDSEGEHRICGRRLL